MALFFFCCLGLSLLSLQVDRLMELYFKYLDAMQAADKKIDGEKHVCIAEVVLARVCDASAQAWHLHRASGSARSLFRAKPSYLC